MFDSHVVIERGSEAYAELDRIMHDPATYKISIDVRRLNVLDRNIPAVAIKQNEQMWSPTLEVTDNGVNPPSAEKDPYTKYYDRCVDQGIAPVSMLEFNRITGKI